MSTAPDRFAGRQRGVALISAIFLLVVLAGLTLYMLSLSGTQHFTAMWAVQGARAHYAAQSGLQWGAWQALNGGGCNGSVNVNAGGPQVFPVEVTCNSSTHQELGVARTVWQIEAVATLGTLGSPNYVRRHQRALVTQ